MIKIALVAPYQEFEDNFKVIFERCRAAWQRGDAEEYSLDARTLFDQEVIGGLRLDCDVIIARAQSAKLLSRQDNFVPVVDIMVQAVDIIRCIKRAWQKYGRRRIIYPGTYSMVSQGYQVPELIDADLKIIEMPSTVDSELHLLFSRMTDREAIIIGGYPVCRMAALLGFRHYLVESGSEAMALALEEARRIANATRHEAEKAQQIRTILDTLDDGILSVDKRGIVTYFNSMAEHILELSRDRVMGVPAGDAIRDPQFLEFLHGHSDCRDELLRYRSPGGGTAELAAGRRAIFLGERQIGTVISLRRISELQDSEVKLRTKLSEKEHKAKHRFYEILGRAPTIVFAVNQAQKFSQAEASVLITGRSGTGKELFAQSMHNASRRKSFPFVAINCAAIPENLLESELFGYVEGAFTGAVRGGKMGLIEMAHRGTLFLDEISELPLSLQARLLRVLQEKEIRRLGHDRVINVDIRVISATNRDLHELVRQGRFREDLYYRLDVLRLDLPSLSERREDIPLLCHHYIEQYASSAGRPAPEFSDGALSLLCSLPWEGNIRELCNVCQRLIVMCDSGSIGVRLVEEAISRTPAALRDDRVLVEALLAQGVPKGEIATRLGIERSTLWRRMKKWGLG